MGRACALYRAVIHYRKQALSLYHVKPHVNLHQCTANMRDVKVHQSATVDACTSEGPEVMMIGEGGRWREICQRTELEDKQALADLKRNR